MGHWEWDAVRGAYHHTVWLTADLGWCPEVNLLSARARAENLNALPLLARARRRWVHARLRRLGRLRPAMPSMRALSREMADLIHSYPNKWVMSEGSRSIQEAIFTDGFDSFMPRRRATSPSMRRYFRKPGLGTLVEYLRSAWKRTACTRRCMPSTTTRGRTRLSTRYDVRRPLDFESPADLARAKLAHALHLTLPLIPTPIFPRTRG